MSKELWIEIHDYSPPNTGENSIGRDGAADSASTNPMHSETANESHTKSKAQGVEVQDYAEESSNKKISNEER